MNSANGHDTMTNRLTHTDDAHSASPSLLAFAVDENNVEATLAMLLRRA